MLQKIICITLLLNILPCFIGFIDSSQNNLMLMPYPMQVVIKNESGMTIDRNFFTELKGFSSEFLTYAVERLHSRIETQTGLPV